MSKKYIGKTCVYCGVKRSSTTGDHVVARQFIPTEYRGGIPIVPSCHKCNNDKSKLEHYAVTVLPFGSRTGFAVDMLKKSVENRLKKNLKLTRELREKSARIWIGTRGGIIEPLYTLPLQYDKINKLMKYIVRGLTYYHWNYILPGNYIVDVKTIDEKMAIYFRDNVLSMSPENYLEGNIGNGVFKYACTRADDDPGVSVWGIEFYEGLIMASGNQTKPPRPLFMTCWVGPKHIISAT